MSCVGSTEGEDIVVANTLVRSSSGAAITGLVAFPDGSSPGGASTVDTISLALAPAEEEDLAKDMDGIEGGGALDANAGAKFPQK